MSKAEKHAFQLYTRQCGRRSVSFTGHFLLLLQFATCIEDEGDVHQHRDQQHHQQRTLQQQQLSEI